MPPQPNAARAVSLADPRPLASPRPLARSALLALAIGALLALLASAPASALPSGFQEDTPLTGLDFPTQVRFAPDGSVFVAEKSGIVKEFSSLTDTTPTTVVDLRSDVFNAWDRGLLGLALDPSFPTKP